MTETTTQPDPRVVAWMRGYRDRLPPGVDPSTARTETVREYRNGHREEAQRLGLRALVDAYAVAARRPLTVTDIPAGQGAASLYLTRSDGELDLYYRHGDGIGDRILILDPHPALRDHLAATLPTVIDTTEESK